MEDTDGEAVYELLVPPLSVGTVLCPLVESVLPRPDVGTPMFGGDPSKYEFLLTPSNIDGLNKPDRLSTSLAKPKLLFMVGCVSPLPFLGELPVELLLGTGPVGLVRPLSCTEFRCWGLGTLLDDAGGELDFLLTSVFASEPLLKI
jgi:hypothetical protein